MTTKAERNLEEELGPSPWPMYEDKDEPWTDPERMLKLDEEFDYQYEIAHVLDTSPSKVSYWMEKAKEHAQEEALKAGETCIICEENEVPGGEGTGNGACPECLDRQRHERSNQI